jgi:L-iditol 2-dehydrogenase
LAEQVITTGEQVVGVPPGTGPFHAVLAQPLACVSYALSRVEAAGRRVAIAGVGAAGSLFDVCADACEAASIVGVDLVDRTRLDPRPGSDEHCTMPSRQWAGRLGNASDDNGRSHFRAPLSRC